MPQTTTPPGICRICSAHCGVLATVTDGKLTANTIDQRCKQVALAAHGHWLGGDVDVDEADSWMLIGTIRSCQRR